MSPQTAPPTDLTVLGAARTLIDLASDRAGILSTLERDLFHCHRYIPVGPWTQMQGTIERLRLNEATSQAVRQALDRVLGIAAG